jgi:hypothetical protein
MPYLIDGHNLIPKVPGLSLKEFDDENHLIRLMQEFCRQARKRVEIYFDNAAPGQPASQKFGAVTAHYVRQGRTADEAIRDRLRHMGKSASNWTVVSSDRAVQDASRAWRAQVISSDEFVRKIQATLSGVGNKDDEQRQVSESGEDVEEWLSLFGGNKPE